MTSRHEHDHERDSGRGEAPEGVMTRARVASPAKDADAGDTVTLTGKGGTKVTAPAHMAAGLRSQGYK